MPATGRATKTRKKQRPGSPRTRSRHWGGGLSRSIWPIPRRSPRYARGSKPRSPLSPTMRAPCRSRRLRHWGCTSMAERSISFKDAVLEALAEEMRVDPSVVLIGEDIGAAGGVFLQTRGLFDEFGASRVIDTPISESAIVGMAIGAAMTGLRPIVEIGRAACRE